MSENVRDSHAATADGLSPKELQAEQAGDLPDRDAMSILDVGGIGAGLPVPTDIGLISGPAIDPVPAVQPPIEVVELTDQLPLLDRVDQVLADGGTIDQTVDSRLDALPDLPTVSVGDSETIA